MYQGYDLKVLQSKEPIDEYVENVVLEWKKPQKPSTCEITHYVLTIRDDSGEIVREKIQHHSEPRHQVPDRKLQSGSSYFYSVDTIVKYRDGDVDTFQSDELRFSTRPGKPRQIHVKCNESVAEVQWSTCRGADKFSIKLLSVDYKGSLDYHEVPGSCHKCKFDIDPNRGIYLGESYKIIVIAYKSDWRNTGTQICFFGDDESPKSVIACVLEGTSEVNLLWQAPKSSSPFVKMTYEVEVVSEDGKTRQLGVTSKTSIHIEDLKGGMAHRFRVASVNGSARSFWSTSNAIITRKYALEVENLRVEPNEVDPERSLACYWDALQGAIGYELQYRSPGKSHTVKLSQTDSKYVIKDLDPLTSYAIRIKAEDESGFGPYCQDVIISTLEMGIGILEQGLKWNTKTKSKFKITANFPTLREPTFQPHPQMEKINNYFGDGVNVDESKSSKQTSKGEAITNKQFLEEITIGKSKRIALVGGGGFGKTTELKKLAKTLLGNEDQRQDLLNREQFQIIHWINLKSVEDEETTLQKLLFDDLNLNKSDMKFLLDWIYENQSKVIFLFDGLDKTQFDTGISYEEIRGLNKKKSVGCLIHNLLSGYFFPDVKIIITSREYSIINLPEEARPDLVIALTGFTQNDAEKLLVEVSDGIDDQTIQNIRQLDMIRIPVYTIFAAVVHKFCKEDVSKYESGLLSKILEIFTKSTQMSGINVRNIGTLHKMMELSYEGCKQKRFTFDEEDLKRHRLDITDVSDMMRVIPKENIHPGLVMKGYIILMFCHRTLQKFLAACHISKKNFVDFQSFTKQNINIEGGISPHWMDVIQYVCGITLNSQFQIDKQVHEVTDKERKQKLLRDTLQELLRNSADASIYLLLHECNDDSLIRQLERIKIAHTTLQHSNLARVIPLLMKRAPSIILICLPWCNITGTHIRVLAADMKDTYFRLNLRGLSVSFQLAYVTGRESPTNLIKQMSFRTWKSDDANHGIVLEFLEDAAIEEALVDYACYSVISIDQVRWWHKVKNLNIKHIRWTIEGSNDNLYGFLTEILQKCSAKEVHIKHEHDSSKSIGQVREWREVENLEVRFGSSANSISFARSRDVRQELSRNALKSVMLEIREANDDLYEILPEVLQATYAEEMVIYNPRGHVLSNTLVTWLLRIESMEVKILNIDRYHELRQSGNIPSTATLKSLGEVAKQCSVKCLQLLCTILKESDISAIKKGCGEHSVEIIDQGEYLKRLKFTSSQITSK